jgi:F0F1-type ATP synthase membrane subunit b/b'
MPEHIIGDLIIFGIILGIIICLVVQPIILFIITHIKII